MLSDLGSERLTKNEIGSNALHVAVKQGNIQTIKELIALEFPLDIPKANGVTALGLAAISGNIPILKMLILAKADVNYVSIKPNPGNSALSLAISGKNYEIADILLQNGAKVFFNYETSIADLSPIFLAIKN
jgi:ankyrin repeat protein